jgi:hypothetical protein
MAGYLNPELMLRDFDGTWRPGERRAFFAMHEGADLVERINGALSEREE